MLSRREVEVLLSKLCIDLGFCLPPDDQKRLAEQPPVDAHAFTDAVFSAEGLDPTTADRHLYRQVRDMVLEAFRDSVIARENDA
jgi:hypothetical protein